MLLIVLEDVVTLLVLGGLLEDLLLCSVVPVALSFTDHLTSLLVRVTKVIILQTSKNEAVTKYF